MYFTHLKNKKYFVRYLVGSPIVAGVLALPVGLCILFNIRVENDPISGTRNNLFVIGAW